MNDENSSFKFQHNGVNYTVTIRNLDQVLRDFSDQINEDILVQESEFAEAREVIARIKSKL